MTMLTVDILDLFSINCVPFTLRSRRLYQRAIANMPKADTPPGFKPLKDTQLFSPFKLGSLNLEYRIVQAH
ncbi:hypothetical protein DE146DRAFT_671959 [Phaeosphaeria sp. MPI-PUGE-AT-0046c]|nr:hypothetical protein DE146DRAFT_671959 [Phaeosphaeria sp. MPI-PUGE-AT-0046c]